MLDRKRKTDKQKGEKGVKETRKHN